MLQVFFFFCFFNEINGGDVNISPGQGIRARRKIVELYMAAGEVGGFFGREVESTEEGQQIFPTFQILVDG